MKICLFSDVHWNTNSSLIRKYGDKYSVRLEYLIKTIDWVNEVAIKENCDQMFCLGDFFDKSSCSDIELTALQDINWNSLPCYFLCGNHESSVSDLRFSTLKVLESPNHKIINTLTLYETPDCNFMFLPYLTEFDRKELTYYINKTADKPLVIISHNEIAGINYGGFVSKAGFEISEIENNCQLFLNGHLHNSEWVTPKILNVGSVSAHNFTNDSSKYSYGLWILDTSTLKLKFIENPFSFNFYKLDILSKNDLNLLHELKSNAVLSIRCYGEFVEDINKLLNTLNTVIESRITVIKSDLDIANNVITIADLHSDHLSKFVEFCNSSIANSDILQTELSEICK